MLAHALSELCRFRIELDRRFEHDRRGLVVSVFTQAQDRLGDERQIAAVDVESAQINLGGLFDPIVIQHQLGDALVFADGLLEQSLTEIELGQLDPWRRIGGLEIGHLAMDLDGRGAVAVLLVVVGHHLVLATRLVEQTLPVVESASRS